MLFLRSHLFSPGAVQQIINAHLERRENSATGPMGPDDTFFVDETLERLRRKRGA